MGQKTKKNSNLRPVPRSYFSCIFDLYFDLYSGINSLSVVRKPKLYAAAQASNGTFTLSFNNKLLGC